MNEQSKAAARRVKDWRYANRWLVGRGLDVGPGPDPLSKEVFPNISEVVPYDVELGHKDGQYLPEIPDKSFNFVHSSHSLEHLRNPRIAIINWLRVLMPGGYIVCTVPDELLYESGRWPSTYNPDHKVSFTLRCAPVISGSANLMMLLWKLPLDVEHVSLLTEHWDNLKIGKDQTLEEAECAIEFVARKPSRGIPA